MMNALQKAILKDARERKARAKQFICLGYDNDTERGLRYHSTERRFEQFKNGEITRKQANELAIKRAFKEIDKDTEKYLNRIETAATAPTIISISISVEWHKSSMWGYNPSVELIARDENGKLYRSYGSASGCGYDKESAATGQAIGQINGILKDAYKIKNKALNKDKNATSHSCLGYGSGYGVLPYFEGGVGFGCHESILKKCGFELKNRTSGKTYTNYYFERV